MMVSKSVNASCSLTIIFKTLIVFIYTNRHVACDALLMHVFFSIKEIY
jgi:hypothetical protein